MLLLIMFYLTKQFIKNNLDEIISDLLSAYELGILAFENLSYDSYMESFIEFVGHKANTEELDIDFYEYKDLEIEPSLINFNSVGTIISSLEIEIALNLSTQDFQKFFEIISKIDIDAIKLDVIDAFTCDAVDFNESDIRDATEYELRSEILNNI